MMVQNVSIHQVYGNHYTHSLYLNAGYQTQMPQYFKKIVINDMKYLNLTWLSY